jgi:hypothetical protein
MEHHVKTMVEAPDDRGIGFIPCPWRFEMEYLANKTPRVGTLCRDIMSGHYIVGCVLAVCKKIGPGLGQQMAISPAAARRQESRISPRKWMEQFLPAVYFLLAPPEKP